MSFQILTWVTVQRILVLCVIKEKFMFYLFKKANQRVCTNYFKVSDVGSWIQAPHSVTSRLGSIKKTLCIWAIFTHQKLSQMHGFLRLYLLRAVITARSLGLRSPTQWPPLTKATTEQATWRENSTGQEFHKRITSTVNPTAWTLQLCTAQSYSVCGQWWQQFKI